MEDFVLPTPTGQENKVIQPAEILDGKEALGLAESMRTYSLESGDLLYAGTDKGIDYKDHNEDRIVVVPAKNFAAVVDGMGGLEQGEVAAQILAEELKALPTDVKSAAQNAITKMVEHKIQKGGAVFVSCRLLIEHDSKFFELFQLGDSSLVVIDTSGHVVFESEDDSMTGRLVADGVITPDQALYFGTRHMVSSAVSPNKAVEITIPKSCEKVKLEKGNTVILMSDGISDNLTVEDIAKKIKEGLSPKELFTWISTETDRRMRDASKIIEFSERKKNGIYSDGFKSEPKPDNRALAILEIK